MARKKQKDQPAERSDKEKLLIRVRERYQIMTDADDENRRLSIADLKFVNVPGEQWDSMQKQLRGDRPCYEFNKLRVSCKRVINDMRANRPQGKVRGTEDNNVDTAEVYEGLCRNIWNVSDGDTVIDYAAEYQVGGGMGAWRVVLDEERDAFTQSIKVEAIKNPFCLYGDPAATDQLKRDAADWILTERISKAAFERRWPNAEVLEFGDGLEFDDQDEWQDDESVRICEYWYKEPYEKTIALLSDGRTIAGDDIAQVNPALILKSRKQKCERIKMCIVSGDAVLEGPVDWAGERFPFVLLYGEWIVIDGRVYWFGLTRFAKDAQRNYNVARTAIAEKVAMAPMAKFWATPEQAKGHLEKWSEAHNKGYPVLLANSDPKQPGFPQMMPSDPVPASLITESQIASEEIKAVTGIYDASLGAKSNEQSGRAITARQQQGEIATFNFSDNMGKAIRYTWEIFVDLIPKVYDTARTMRILGVDGAEKYVKVNHVEIDPATNQAKRVNDLGQGKYDVTVTVGPSFATKRMEAADAYNQMLTALPTMAPVFADLAVKAMDLPYADQVAERLKTMLPPQVQQMLGDGKDKPLPPEAQAAMAQANQAMQQVQEHNQLVQAAAQEVQQGAQENEKARAAVQSQLDKLAVQRALFDADVAKQIAAIEIAQARAQMADTKDAASRQVDAANQSAAAAQAAPDGEQPQDPQALPEPMTGEDAVRNIQASANTFVQQAQAAIAAIHESMRPPPVAPESIGKHMSVRRENGHIIAESHEQLSDGTVKQRAARLKRVNGELRGDLMTVHSDGTQQVHRVRLARGPAGELVGQFEAA